MTKPAIAILFGGNSAEYKVSLQSAYAVIQHLNTDKYNPVLIGITQQGRWLRYRGKAEDILADSWHQHERCTPAVISPCRAKAGLIEQAKDGIRLTPLNAAFPILHGTMGEDGTVQGLLELAGIPIIGCGTLASALCMDKDRAHALVAAHGIAVPKSLLFSQANSLPNITKAAASIGYPLFVKPLRAGSSIGVSKVNKESELPLALNAAFAQDTHLLIEEAIAGFEVGCAVLGDTRLVLGEPDEVELADGFFDFIEKYNLKTSKIHVPARVDAETTKKIQNTAACIYRALGCSGFARVDMFLQPNGELVFNEVNTIPGFTPHSRYPTMMKSAGLDFNQLVDQLIAGAVPA